VEDLKNGKTSLKKKTFPQKRKHPNTNSLIYIDFIAGTHIELHILAQEIFKWKGGEVR